MGAPKRQSPAALNTIQSHPQTSQNIHNIIKAPSFCNLQRVEHGTFGSGAFFPGAFLRQGLGYIGHKGQETCPDRCCFEEKALARKTSWTGPGLWDQGVSPHFCDTSKSLYMNKIVFGKPFPCITEVVIPHSPGQDMREPCFFFFPVLVEKSQRVSR